MLSLDVAGCHWMLLSLLDVVLCQNGQTVPSHCMEALSMTHSITVAKQEEATRMLGTLYIKYVITHSCCNPFGALEDFHVYPQNTPSGAHLFWGDALCTILQWRAHSGELTAYSHWFGKHF